LFHRSGWTQEGLAKKEGKSQRHIGRMLCFGLLLPPILQDQNYHHFADERTLLRVPNFWNVVSSLLFIGVGAGRAAKISS
jgi:hypothetical protein